MRHPLLRGLATALAVAALAVLPAACGGGEPGPGQASPSDLVASPLPPDGSPAPAPSVTPSATTPSAAPSPSPEPSSTPHPPSDTEQARFVAGYQPDNATDLEHVAIDLNGDGVDELVFTYARTDANVAHVDIAFWDGTAYHVDVGADGGPADRIDKVQLTDVNADGVTEVVLFESTSSGGGSLTMWQLRDHRLVPLRGQGGCDDGTNTYGVIGAKLEDRNGDGSAEIYATCDESPLPVAAWGTDRYVWQNGAYTYAPQVG